MVALLIVTYAVIAISPTAPGKAAPLPPTSSPSAQVRIFENGVFAGGGTLVDRNWVLTALHLFDQRNNPAAYTIRFGVVNDQDDANDTTNLRSIERIVSPPQGGDIAMVRLANPVPVRTWTPRLATRPPERWAEGRLYEWGSDNGHTLNRNSTVVYDPVAAANAAHRRSIDPVFAWAFPDRINPMVLDLVPADGDSGSGIFVDLRTLTGVHTGEAEYYLVDSAGHLDLTTPYAASFNQPVWMYRQWILDTINGAGPSSSNPGQGRPPGRRLTDANGNLPMTMPPQTAFCDEDTPCNAPAPAWAQGILLGAGNYRGTAQARCATAQNNTCTFNGTPYPPGTSARMTLGPNSAPLAPGTRKVMVWCKTTSPFPNPDSPTQQVLRISFTNADPHLSPIGYGWWDLTPDQVTTPNNQTPLNTSQLNPC